jgi:hypothetical protein
MGEYRQMLRRDKRKNGDDGVGVQAGGRVFDAPAPDLPEWKAILGRLRAEMGSSERVKPDGRIEEDGGSG